MVSPIRRCSGFWVQSCEPRHSYCQADDHWCHYLIKWQLSFTWDKSCTYWREECNSLGWSTARKDPWGAVNTCGALSAPSKSQTRGDPAWERSSRVYVLVGQLLCWFIPLWDERIIGATISNWNTCASEQEKTSLWWTLWSWIITSNSDSICHFGVWVRNYLRQGKFTLHREEGQVPSHCLSYRFSKCISLIIHRCWQMLDCSISVNNAKNGP